MKGLFLALAILGLLSACASSPSSVQPLTAKQHGYLSTEREQKLIRISEENHRELVNKGLIDRDPASHAYLNRIGLQLVPEAAKQAQSFNFYILKSASVNAFAMPNGNIYLNIGLLSKLDNEAELALVLSHEIAHVVERHSYQGRLNRHNTVVAAHIADLFLFGTGLAYIPAGFELASHSREQEKEADLKGLEYLSATDYDLAQSIAVFGKLVEVKHPEKSTSIWASHPDSQNRAVYSQQVVEERYSDRPRTRLAAEEYEIFRRNIAELNIKIRLRNMQFELSEDAIEEEIKQQGEQAKWYYYRGESYRRKGLHPAAAAREYAWLYDKKADEDLIAGFSSKAAQYYRKAIAEYQKALALNPDYISATRGLGLTAYQQRNYAEARQLLERYLKHPDRGHDDLYIKKLLQKIGDHLDAPNSD